MSQAQSEPARGSPAPNDAADTPTLRVDAGPATPAYLADHVPLPRAPEAEANGRSGGGLHVDGLGRRKNTSFKITNILSSAPPSNDQDESGEDDPDDSR
jgi:hypothetical protein